MDFDHLAIVGFMNKYPSVIVPALVLTMKIGVKNVVGRVLDVPTVYTIFMDVPTDLMFLSISVCAGIASHAGKMSPISTETLLLYLIFSFFVVLFWRISTNLFMYGQGRKLIYSGGITIFNYIVSISVLAHAFAVSISKG